jgi:hypothetical protein
VGLLEVIGVVAIRNKETEYFQLWREIFGPCLQLRDEPCYHLENLPLHFQANNWQALQLTSAPWHDWAKPLHYLALMYAQFWNYLFLI